LVYFADIVTNSSAALVRSRDDLLEVVAAMNLVKSPPLLRGQGAQDGVSEQASLRAKSLLSICERCIHGNEGIIELAKGFVAHTRLRSRVLGRFDSWWKPANAEHVEAAKMLACTGA
jgi:hypothetical protein